MPATAVLVPSPPTKLQHTTWSSLDVASAAAIRTPACPPADTLEATECGMCVCVGKKGNDALRPPNGTIVYVSVGTRERPHTRTPTRLFGVGSDRT
ncbi:MAG: hypothetical protein CMI16_07165 [Opitutaceae bacterium]|nr:hypothetical protein [Opitutaceae bacterium]